MLFEFEYKIIIKECNEFETFFKDLLHLIEQENKFVKELKVILCQSLAFLIY